MSVKIERSRYDVIINFGCLILLSATVIYLAVNWKDLPEKIPGHYNIMGEVDRWGNKGELLILPIVTWIMYFGMTVLEHYPQNWNTGVAVTEKNTERVYRVLKNMIGTLKFVVVGIFTFLSINSALAEPLPVWFLPAALISCKSIAFE